MRRPIPFLSIWVQGTAYLVSPKAASTSTGGASPLGRNIPAELETVVRAKGGRTTVSSCLALRRPSAAEKPYSCARQIFFLNPFQGEGFKNIRLGGECRIALMRNIRCTGHIWVCEVPYHGILGRMAGGKKFK